MKDTVRSAILLVLAVAAGMLAAGCGVEEGDPTECVRDADCEPGGYCTDAGRCLPRTDGDQADGDQIDGDQTDGDTGPDGDTGGCTHLCDCPQGWFCNADSVCEDGTGLLGTPFCCDNPGCTPGAPCEHRDGSYGRCGETDGDTGPDGDTQADGDTGCDCDGFIGTYCPGAANPCEEVTQVRVEATGGCSFRVFFDSIHDPLPQVENVLAEGCGEFRVNTASGCGVHFVPASGTFEIACNWCGVSQFEKGRCDECSTWADCPGCSLCHEIGGRRRCVGIGDYGCIDDTDCESGNFCRPFRLDDPGCGGTCETAPSGSYELHEWGVNTPLAGGRAEMQSGPARFRGAVPAKPVLYIYADRDMTIDAGVRFASGGTTETWPRLPNGPNALWEGVQVTKGVCRTTPTPPPPDQMGPEPPEDLEIYQLPEWVVDEADCLTHGETVSKLLFYTGRLDAYAPPVEASAELVPSSAGGPGAIRFQLRNLGTEPVGKMLLLYRNGLGECMDPSYCPVRSADLAWDVIDGVAPGQVVTPVLPLTHLETDEEWSPVIPPQGWLDLALVLKQELSRAGLTAAETRVFLDTWQEMFFGLYADDIHWFLPGYRNGAFLIHLWPAAHAAGQLPLLLRPAPAKVVRAIVQHQFVRGPFEQGEGAIAGTVKLVEYAAIPGDPVWEGPAAGARVQVWSNGSAIAEAVAGGNGGYRLTVAPGAYTVTAERNDWETGDRVEGVVVWPGETTDLDLTIVSEAMVDKPNLYLYPTATTGVAVTLATAPGCGVVTSEPEYGDGWRVTVEPDGTIDGRYGYLFYEAEIPRRYTPASGWSVAAGELGRFFDRTLAAYNLNPRERADFIDYWTVNLPAAPYYAVLPLTDPAVLDRLVGLSIVPVPDSLFRLWLVIAPLAVPRELPEPVIVPAVRDGFTAVEWGVIVEAPRF